MPVIKKYENRRLYDTSASRYVNLDDVAKLLEQAEELTVVDVKTGRDLTSQVLLQIIADNEGATALLPASLLRRVMRACGSGPGSELAREQLSLGLSMLEQHLEQSEALLAGLNATVGPMFLAEPPPTPYDAGPPALSDPAWRSPGEGQEELDELRAELERLEVRLRRS